jgi:hypothetical protein
MRSSRSVEHKERTPLSQEPHNPSVRRLVNLRLNLEGGRDCGGDRVGTVDRSELADPDAVRVLGTHLVGDVNAESTLTHTAGSGERDQAVLLEHSDDRGEIGGAPHERVAGQTDRGAGRGFVAEDFALQRPELGRRFEPQFFAEHRPEALVVVERLSVASFCCQCAHAQRHRLLAVRVFNDETFGSVGGVGGPPQS